MHWNSMVGWSRLSLCDAGPMRLLRISALSFITLTMFGCASPWSIERVTVNPAGPLGGIANVNPVVLVAPATAGGPGGFQLVETVVQYRRDPNFNGSIHTIVTLFLYPPNANRHFSVIHLPTARANSSRTEDVIFHAICRRIEHANGPASVELYVQTAAGSGGSATVQGTTQASTQAEIDVASRTDTANPNDWPVQQRALRVPITCLRDDPAAPRPPAIPPPPLTPQQKCIRDCLMERNACMAEVPEAGGPRPQQCVTGLIACQRSCRP
jgi:hypothetical protein